MAERLGRAFLAQVMGEGAEQVRIVSAGTRAVVGSSMHPDSALVLRGFGAEAGDFRARQLADGMAIYADLTLTMTRAHRDHVLQRAPRALARTFTLWEGADLLQRIDAGPHEGTTLADRARSLVSALAAARSARHSGVDDDVCDPIGQPLEVHEEVCTLIVDTLLPILSMIAEQSVAGEARF